MGDMLSQAEIEALLGDQANAEAKPDAGDANFSDVQKDLLGEVGNITMGTAATTLFALLNHKVLITTPQVSIVTWGDMSNRYDRPCVGVRVDYKIGIVGSNILVLKQKDVRIISNLMMGGDGNVEDEAELSELDLSAISEAMNQMVGSSSTSMSSMMNRKIDIETPHAFVLDFNDDSFFEDAGYNKSDLVVAISFKMEVGDLINSELLQILPVDFARDIVNTMLANMETGGAAEPASSAPAPAPQPAPQAAAPQPVPQAPAPQPIPQAAPAMAAMPQAAPAMMAMPQSAYAPQQTVSVQPAQFQNFDLQQSLMQEKENIDIIMDVPLEVSVELGRTNKKIKEILDFSPGAVIELDRLAGEPIDILVNGKFVAKGEVVVIDENFGIRITDIISADKRI
jgi:flagellar motor switch protein FliN/FliY